ncbi:hypothetical protein chiPu_0026657, partial [Chiloscyllium punctatum]|nr:hypothetical protein [Chiloscyllium punctatum]
MMFQCIPVMSPCTPVMFQFKPVLSQRKPVISQCTPVMSQCTPVIHQCMPEVYREEQLVNRLMRQSLQERRIAVQLMLARHEKQVITQNRIFREKQYEEKRLQEFQEVLDKEA